MCHDDCLVVTTGKHGVLTAFFLTSMDTALAYYVSYCLYVTFGSTLYLLARSSDLFEYAYLVHYSRNLPHARILFSSNTTLKSAGN